MYDAIVVGARVAGSPLAMHLARRGYRVLAVDRATFPSDTVSTHYIHQNGLARLRAWGLLDELLGTEPAAIRQAHFGYRGLQLSGWAEPVDGIDTAYAPRRTVLDALLVDAARRAGAEVIEGFTVAGLVFSEGRVVGIRGQERDRPMREFRAPIVVGADGCRSMVAAQAGAEAYKVVPATGVNYYAYYSGLDGDLHHRVGLHETWCGAWPTHDGLTVAAVICGRSRFKEFRRDVPGNYQAVWDEIHPELGAQMRDQGRRESDFVAMPHADNYYRQPWGPGWALVGDAAYHKDPYPGFGITDAFIHGEILAERLDQALSGERPFDDALAEYHKLRDEMSSENYEFTTTLSAFGELSPRLRGIFGAIRKSPEWTTRLFGLFAGGVGHDEIFSPEAVRRLYEETGTPHDRRVHPAGSA
ncbi:NAD(P)/FAD-dependent oxidoreductase [Yinghuangia soli]|uniref:NAD(P)/FAD-dependent oxidoreductase n=1 Tax=Yinghuangia soli TaxID=2908204 RepID=A0AA41U3G7_9ACTN|nr:NAD(P)/FAD-dependent oxidoreductase [Yinghuangia soli]MCF2531796.1 NAD(P)/FAD-dependent oxidoreductase [Yinghuangia soli]